MEEKKEQMPQGWADIQITPDMPLMALLGFINVMNQRLVNLENIVTTLVDNKPTTLTELYKIEAEKQKAEMEQQLKDKDNK